ncbi:MAG: hypothetical protein KY475_01340 [Planctomycetes bacterium]|nr:hypothetical protein [Planctomycetota bacterium]
MTRTSDLDLAPLEALRRIDRICDRYEESLQAGDRPPLEALLEAVDEPHRPPLLRALLEVELEYRRVWGEKPAADEYAARFPAYQEAIDAAFEPDAGDEPDLAADERCLVQMVLSQATGRRADRIRIYYRSQLAHTALLTGPVELGRQRQGEAPPFSFTSSQRGDRLIVAPLEETSVSRHHARLAPEGEDRIRVTNLSNVNPIVFADGRRLEFDQSESLPLNLEMTLGAVFVRIDRPGVNGDNNLSATTPAGSDEESSERNEVRPGLFKRLWGRER